MTPWFSCTIVPQYRQAEVCGRRFRGKEDCLIYLPCIVKFTMPSLQLSMSCPVKYGVLCHRNARFGQLQRTVIPSLALGNYQQANRSLLHVYGRLKSKSISSHLISLLQSRVVQKASLSITHLPLLYPPNSTNFLFWTHQLQCPENQQPASPILWQELFAYSFSCLLLSHHHISNRFHHDSFLIWRCGKNCIETWLCCQITSHQSSQFDAAFVVIEVVKPGTCKPRNDDRANRNASLAARYLISNKEGRTSEISLSFVEWPLTIRIQLYDVRFSEFDSTWRPGLPEAYHFSQPSAPILAISESQNSSSSESRVSLVASEIREMFKSSVIKGNALNMGARMTAPILTVQLALPTYPSPFLWILPTIHSMSQP